jgi:hypothetical protein
MTSSFVRFSFTLFALFGCGIVTTSNAQDVLPTPLPVLEGPVSLPPDQDPRLGPLPGEAFDGSNQDIEELARGPVHEAFAEQITYDPIPGPIIAEPPPAPVPELPPEYKPEGDNVVFIGGYWFWDDARNEYIWISGGYRQLPPDQTWVEGYWHEVDGGWQRVSGFFAVTTPEVSSYYRSPPESLELGPVGQAPSQDYSWSPGYWESQGDEFVWRVGHWYECRPGWVWVPHYWRWTPRGCVLVGGYWDYPWETRGQVFAPVCFNRPVYNQVGFFYRPRIILRAAALQLHLFVRPNHCHYYFGDYYGANYVQTGFIPWHAYHTGYNRIGCDPIFAYSNWNYRRQGIDFLNINIQWNRYYNQNPNFRPPHTFAAQQNFIRNINNNVVINNTTINNTTIINQTIFTDRLERAVQQTRPGGGKWSRLDDLQLQSEIKTAEQWRDSQRRRAESESATVFLNNHRGQTLDPERQRRYNDLAKTQQQVARDARRQAEEQLQRKQNPGNNGGGARSKVVIDRAQERDLQKKLNETLVVGNDQTRVELPKGERRGDEPSMGVTRRSEPRTGEIKPGNERNNGLNNGPINGVLPNNPVGRNERNNDLPKTNGNADNTDRDQRSDRGNNRDRGIVNPRGSDNARGNESSLGNENSRGNENERGGNRRRESQNDRNNAPGLLPVPETGNGSGKTIPLNPNSGAGRVPVNPETKGNDRRGDRDNSNRNAAGEIVVPKNPGERRPFHVPNQPPATTTDNGRNPINPNPSTLVPNNPALPANGNAGNRRDNQPVPRSNPSVNNSGNNNNDNNKREPLSPNANGNRAGGERTRVIPNPGATIPSNPVLPTAPNSGVERRNVRPERNQSGNPNSNRINPPVNGSGSNNSGGLNSGKNSNSGIGNSGVSPLPRNAGGAPLNREPRREDRSTVNRAPTNPPVSGGNSGVDRRRNNGPISSPPPTSNGAGNGGTVRNNGGGRSFVPPANGGTNSGISGNNNNNVRSNPPPRNRDNGNAPRNQNPPKSGGGGGRQRDK